MNQKETGLFIAVKRREQNLTQEQLAEKIGVSNRTVSKWETGKSMPDYSIVERLCEVLNISISELLAGKEAEAVPDRAAHDDELALLSYKIEQLEKSQRPHTETSKTVHTGISLGSALAIVISYAHWRSIGWAILHGVMGWGYVIYYLIKY